MTSPVDREGYANPHQVSLVVDLPPKAKARPRVTQNGTYMPPAYAQWKRDFAVACHGYPWRVIGRFSIVIRFYTPTGRMRCDLDNAAAAVLDALQDAGVIENDRDCVEIFTSADIGNPTRIAISLVAL